MRLGYLLWLIAIIIAVLVGLSKFAGISVPQVTDVLMKDSTLSLFVALGLAILAKIV
jgi:hypothetical protein